MSIEPDDPPGDDPPAAAVVAVFAHEAGVDRRALRDDAPVAELVSSDLDLTCALLALEIRFGVELTDDPQSLARRPIGALVAAVQQARRVQRARPVHRR